jgi:hypothetical protein
VDGLEVNLEQVREGSAWVYSRYLRELPVTDRVLYVAAQRLAQAQRRGLWRDEPLGNGARNVAARAKAERAFLYHAVSSCPTNFQSGEHKPLRAGRPAYRARALRHVYASAILE